MNVNQQLTMNPTFDSSFLSECCTFQFPSQLLNGPLNQYYLSHGFPSSHCKPSLKEGIFHHQSLSQSSHQSIISSSNTTLSHSQYFYTSQLIYLSFTSDVAC